MSDDSTSVGTGTSSETGPRAFETVYHRYVPHKTGLPHLPTYLRELWRRREFAFETSKASMRGATTNTFFGQAWLVLNPLLLALVYYLLITVISQNARTSGWEYFAHLTGGLFVFYFFQGSVNNAAGSVVNAGGLVLNTSFPRLLLPLAAVRTGLLRFLPTLPVYLIFHILASNAWTWVTFLVAPIFLGLLAVFASGLAALFAALQVYFRDMTAFLPYIMRIWLYSSPVLWTIEMIQGRPTAAAIMPFNPLYSLIGGYNQALQEGVLPSAQIWLLAVAWAVGSFVLGSWFFMARERDFAVRI
ncbi:ABC transporter permease [Ornithinimicrobium cerasi]|uniref:Teichoic acid transport system permease protein n=1 Tax=Ornithinimicrobium cerasi TaxID=2248773 RepID=A0A285VFP4_9MICO|nr:ABC transporter permease [Ornithinimicrobium cerasi]SOC52388.1 teichoic acid transport system permease protein [Ornithinimicrobium cerasi]